MTSSLVPEMMKLKIVVLVGLLLTAATNPLEAQTVPKPKQISGGVLNGKAISLPTPAYPEEAKQQQASGVINVQVLIDEDGSVISARAVDNSKHPALRRVSEAAALNAKFSPTKLSGQPVKVSGVLTYNFVPSASYSETLSVLGIVTFLNVARETIDSPGVLKEMFEGENMFEGGMQEYPRFADEFRPLVRFEKMSVQERKDALDRSIASFNGKLNESEKWQSSVGEALGRIMGPMMVLVYTSNKPDLKDLTRIEPLIRPELAKLATLCERPAENFPKPVLESLKGLAAEAQKERILDETNTVAFIGKMMALIETLEPGSTK